MYTATSIVTHFQSFKLHCSWAVFWSLLQRIWSKKNQPTQNVAYKSSITIPSVCEAKLQFSKEWTESKVLGWSLGDTTPQTYSFSFLFFHFLQLFFFDGKSFYASKPLGLWNYAEEFTGVQWRAFHCHFCHELYMCFVVIVVVVVVFRLPVRLNYVHSSIVWKISFPWTNKMANLQMTVKKADSNSGIKRDIGGYKQVVQAGMGK